MATELTYPYADSGQFAAAASNIAAKLLRNDASVDGELLRRSGVTVLSYGVSLVGQFRGELPMTTEAKPVSDEDCGKFLEEQAAIAESGAEQALDPTTIGRWISVLTTVWNLIQQWRNS